LYVKSAEEVLSKYKEEKVIQKDNRAKFKAVTDGVGLKEGGEDGI
jgi:hypothetical protein